MNANGSVLTEKEVAEILSRDLAGRRDYALVDFLVSPASSDPLGFLGRHSRVNATVRFGSRIENKSYFAKTLPVGMPSQMEYLQDLRCFYKEIHLYDEVFRELDKAKVPQWHPKYLFSRGENLLVLEDLDDRGYRMQPERRFMDEDHVLRALETMAAMHASSILFEEKLRSEGRSPFTLLELFPRYLFETTASPDPAHPGHVALEAGISAQTKLLDLLPGYTEVERNVIRSELPRRMRKIFYLVKPSQKFRNVIVHGDLWANNLLFLENDDGTAKKALFVDFQLARYAPPAQDIVTFLHLVQTKEFREKNYEKLLRHYHRSLAGILQENGIVPDVVLNWYELLATCDHYRELGLITALYYFQLILAPPETTNKFLSSPELFSQFMCVDRSDLVANCFSSDPVYADRMTEIMNELIKDFILL